jgi:hypothetical protein
MLLYLTFSNLNSIHWIIKKRYRLWCTFQDIFRTFQVNFQDISITLVKFLMEDIPVGTHLQVTSLFMGVGTEWVRPESYSPSESFRSYTPLSPGRFAPIFYSKCKYIIILVVELVHCTGSPVTVSWCWFDGPSSFTINLNVRRFAFVFFKFYFDVKILTQITNYRRIIVCYLYMY